MDFYRTRPEALPRRLYRVDYYDSWSTFIPGSGFQAATLNPNHLRSTGNSTITATAFESASELDAFWQALRDHLNPRSGIRSPFVALFSSGRQARNWALQWEVRNNQRACDVVEVSGIVLSKLDVPTFHPHTLRFRIPDLSNTQRSEYLCLHAVPEAAVVSRRSTSTIPTLAVPRRLSHAPHRPRHPRGAPEASYPSSPPLFDFENYASSEDDDEEDEALDDNLRQRPNRFSTHRVPGLDGGFYHSD